MIEVTIEATPDGVAAIRQRLILAGVSDTTLVPVANVLRIVADLLDKRADVIDEEPVMLGENDSLTFRLTVMP